MIPTPVLIILAVPLTLLILLLLGMGYQLVGGMLDERVYPPRGKLIDVGGYRLHLFAEGEGSTTVVMDAGLGHTAQIWSLVLPAVASFTRACAYDRAGYGWSDSGPQPRTSMQIVKELHTLLNNAGIPAPYVLVGHSFGGLNMYLYALEYPDEVAGLILVDALSKDILTDNPYELRWFISVNRIKFRIQSLLTRLGLFRLYILIRGPYAAMTFVKSLPQAVQRPLLSTFMRRTFHAAALESSTLGESVREVNALSKQKASPPLTIPLTVLAHGIPDMFAGRMSPEETQEGERRWRRLQTALADLSTQGKLVIAEKGGHKIHIDDPALVIETIREMVEGIQKGMQ